uniref:Tbc protein n=1 Tax=Tetraselmis sp. GSL018 TaxID=582737 RepID=A0A061QXG8_9CHLO|mmetsp:Transcript_21742/g.51953  ORF Transcript_21742/g.51953 Transcript_21742/m.51953 type:complete len:366 (+) Transcript_21742:282-1379(+)|eukprot:CAMPEP_0177604516 /NCGR_PEP_ID=MMETSP0419_2-20121207/16164_1 /TAXON_ID=582737 /ORGANISM="Tetraselmis sp., Strain GSL018" /LENGTH=365 /DNA_ID=CAMNT_0019098513 /DNA_START=230 /DNA_END=1327 /DNA_ORIENTATION=+
MSCTELSEFDCYGFRLKLTHEQHDQRARSETNVEKRRRKWKTYFEVNKLPSLQKLKRYLRKGIPPEMRRWVWLEVSGANQVRQLGRYEVLVRQAEETPSPVRNQIELDLPRTFPGQHDWIASHEGQSSLRRVLLAYSMHNEKVGYCQSMNYVAALLLVATGKVEEDSFWLLVALLEGVLYPGMYANNLEGCHVEMKSLGKLLGKKDPRLALHMEKLGCDMNLVSTDWFLCLFCTTLPIETAARVWDCLLLEGPKILYRVALALFRMAEDRLLAADNPGDFLIAMRNVAQTCYDRDGLMKIAFNKLGKMPMDRITRYRREKQEVVDEEMRQREAISRRKALQRSIANGSAKAHRRSRGAAQANGSV